MDIISYNEPKVKLKWIHNEIIMERKYGYKKLFGTY